MKPCSAQASERNDCKAEEKDSDTDSCADRIHGSSDDMSVAATDPLGLSPAFLQEITDNQEDGNGLSAGCRYRGD